MTECQASGRASRFKRFRTWAWLAARITAVACRSGLLLAPVIAWGMLSCGVARAAPAFSRVSSGGHGGDFIVAGPDGAMWMLDSGAATDSPTPWLVRISPSGRVRAFHLPRGSTGPFADLVVGRDGNFWYTDSLFKRRTDKWVVARMTPTGASAVFATGLSTSSQILSGLTMGPRNQLWFTGRDLRTSRIGRMTLAGKRVWVVGRHPSSLFEAAITAGPDGNLWTATGFRVTPQGRVTGYQGGNRLAIVTGADGNLWLSDNGAVDRLTTGGQLTTFRYPPTNPACCDQTLSLAPGPDGNIWFVKGQSTETAFNADGAVGMIDHSGHIVLYPLTSGGAPLGPFAIAAGPDGSMWVTVLGAGGPSILRVTPQKPATGWPAGARPRITGIRSRRGTLTVGLSCGGTPGLFCGGVLRVRLAAGRRHLEMQRTAVLAAGSEGLSIELKPRGLANARAVITATYSTKDFLGRRGQTMLRRTARL